jgi:glutaredoxin 3
MKIEVIGRDNCPFCVMAVDLLKKEGLPFTYKKVGMADTDDITREELLQRAPGVKSVPVIFINDEYIGGYTSLEARLRYDNN